MSHPTDRCAAVPPEQRAACEDAVQRCSAVPSAKRSDCETVVVRDCLTPAADGRYHVTCYVEGTKRNFPLSTPSSCARNTVRFFKHSWQISATPPGATPPPPTPDGTTTTTGSTAAPPRTPHPLDDTCDRYADAAKAACLAVIDRCGDGPYPVDVPYGTATITVRSARTCERIARRMGRRAQSETEATSPAAPPPAIAAPPPFTTNGTTALAAPFDQVGFRPRISAEELQEELVLHLRTAEGVGHLPFTIHYTLTKENDAQYRLTYRITDGASRTFASQQTIVLRVSGQALEEPLAFGVTLGAANAVGTAQAIAIVQWSAPRN